MTHPAKGVLAAHNVSAQYADRTGEPIEALRAVNAQFRPGAMFAIMGPSGSGKTTFVHALAGIVPVSAGEIRFGDTLLSDLSERKRDAWRHAACGMVFQDFRLIEELDIFANVILPATFSSFSVKSAMRTRALALLERFDVPMRSSLVANLSRGQRQRVALARALILDPPIIIADEPTASLDPENSDRIARELAELAGAGKIVVCVTHDDRLAAQASSVLTMSQGRIVDRSDIFKNTA